MSQELLNSFFERDLSDDELQALRDGLDSEEAALLFAEKARAFHQSLGVKRPGLWTLFLRQASVGSLASAGQPQAKGAPIQRGHQLIIRLNLDQAAVVEISVLTAQGEKVCSLGSIPM